MYRILEKQVLSDVTKLMVVEAPHVARKARAGQFVIVRIDERGERIPLTIADYDREAGTITLIFQEVGKSTKHLGTLNVGDGLATLAGPLGHPTEIANYGKVVCVGGGVGIAPIFPIARALKEAGNYVISIIGARTRSLLFWEDRMRAVSDELIVCTDDGSYGRKALVTEPLKELLEARAKEIARVWAIGPAIMMKFVSQTTKPFGVPTIVSLNTIMIDGTGMCGGCRVLLEEGAQFVCVDGPEFDGHKVDWDNLLARLAFYRDEERLAMERWEQEHECRLEGVLKEQEATR
ncbi:MAG: sulfide/dihydroorotate dehydrogenase-like FAD/NAD-binding protein [Anaerolineae bacterium]|nr:sulfide/dihydroorotate dehydrogenase-like FAD/NAD-binding protein [Anaerolineae bacterium]MCX8068059.1 sulfide/dihydroorotate dehydrogenase-like FAD/NAD-binding protein [Anaerolineae bacterium]MDW7992597.1 sulfide/dihydroorotate dehydrogenase-like FAD/NAD-binding protein [Anaerolineae bacterium]